VTADGEKNRSADQSTCNANSRGAWKRRFATREEATRSILRQVGKDEVDGLPPFVYSCESCGDFHIATRQFYNPKPTNKTHRRRRQGSGKYSGA
jgi:hypothetical protein